jgi:hypothetical protein
MVSSYPPEALLHARPCPRVATTPPRAARRHGRPSRKRPGPPPTCRHNGGRAGGWCSAPGGSSRGGAGLRFRCRDGVRPGEVQDPQVAVLLAYGVAVAHRYAYHRVAVLDRDWLRMHGEGPAFVVQPERTDRSCPIPASSHGEGRVEVAVPPRSFVAADPAHHVIPVHRVGLPASAFSARRHAVACAAAAARPRNAVLCAERARPCASRAAPEARSCRCACQQ